MNNEDEIQEEELEEDEEGDPGVITYDLRMHDVAWLNTSAPPGSDKFKRLVKQVMESGQIGICSHPSSIYTSDGTHIFGDNEDGCYGPLSLTRWFEKMTEDGHSLEDIIEHAKEEK